MNVFYEYKPNDFYASYSTSLAFGAHLHSHIELVYMLEGSVEACADTNTSVLQAGDIFMAFPNQIHYYRHIGHEKSVVLIFSPDLCLEYKSILISKAPESPFIRNTGKSVEIHNTLLKLADIKKSQSPYKGHMIKGYLLILLGLLFEKIKFEPVKVQNGSVVKSMLIYCMENYSREIRLEDMAGTLHISKSHISHVFSQKLHTSFSGYINMLRTTAACRLLLSDNTSITEIAYTVGFNSPRTFNRAFLNQMGMTPREYREKEGEGQSVFDLPCGVEG